MSYKIAVATSDGINVDLSFKDTNSFYIYDVNDSGEYSLSDKREYIEEDITENIDKVSQQCGTVCSSGCSDGRGNGCAGGASKKTELIADCRCVLCTKAGFKIQKSLEKKAISLFDVETTIDKAFRRIIPYFSRVDKHINLRGFSAENEEVPAYE